MLVTTCRHCGARFCVTPEQLNIRQGQVRCGQCEQAFSGFESLERFAGDDADTRLLAATQRGQTPHDPLAPIENLESGGGLPGETDLPTIPQLADAAPALPASAPHAARAGPALAEPYLPLPPARPSRAWAFGVALLCLVLGLQLVYFFRGNLARQYVALRPFLESACGPVGCTIPWVNEEAALKLEESELFEMPGSPGQIALQARIRNLSKSAQEYPHVELTLTDVSGRAAVRRVLRPADYVGRALAPGEVMAAGSEAVLSLRIETGTVRPTGYELLLFYP